MTLVEIAFAVSAIAFAFLFGFSNWRSAVPLVAIIVAYFSTYSLMLNRYERTGQAVPRKRTRIQVKFPSGFPRPLLAARVAFFVVVVLMLAFGILPFQFEFAKAGIIGCVFGLIAVAVVNLVLERHYVKKGRGVEVEFNLTK